MRIFSTLKDCFRTGRFKFFFHNLSCELRRGECNPCCYFYKPTLYNKFRYMIGVFLMDWTGMNWKFHARHKKVYPFGAPDVNTLYQWTKHPFPWIRYIVMNYCKQNNIDILEPERKAKEYSHYYKS